MRTQHSDDVQLFRCSGCDRGFSVKSNLKVHMRRCKKLYIEAGKGTIHDDEDVVCRDVADAMVESKEEDFENCEEEEEEECEVVE